MPCCSALQQQCSILPLNAKLKPSKKGGLWRIYRLEVGVEKDPGKDIYHLSDGVVEALAVRLRCKPFDLQRDAFSVVRKSFDARKDPKFVYTVDLDVAKLEDANAIVSRLKQHPGLLEFRHHEQFTSAGSNAATGAQHSAKLSSEAPRIIVVGSGPAGLFAALTLAEMGVGVTLVERGYPVEKRGRDIGRLMARRILDANSNFCFGEVQGGAGTWSDGKLTTRIGKNGVDVRTILQTLVRFGASESILFEGKPHIGTDKLVNILRCLRAHLQALQVNIMFGTKLEDIVVENGRVNGIQVLELGSLTKSIQKCDGLVLAVGHSARDTYNMLLSHGVRLTYKEFAVGFRVEHPQELINKLQYRDWASLVQNGRGKLPVADYKVTAAANTSSKGCQPRCCYSFCMCPGGQIVPTSTDPFHLCINGMSFSKRASRWANAAIVVNVTLQDVELFRGCHGPLAGVEFQKALESEAAALGGGNYVVPAQCLPDFLDEKLSGRLPASSYRLGVRSCHLHNLLPIHLSKILQESVLKFNEQLPGFIDQSALLHGVEVSLYSQILLLTRFLQTRTSSPVTIVRDEETFESLSVKGLYPVGEGAGYAGGIVSAAVDGMKAALAIGKQLGLISAPVMKL